MVGSPPPRSRVDRAAEQAVLACMRRGDTAGMLRLLMTTYGADIQAFALRIVRHPELAKDVCQMVFLEAFQGIARFENRSSLWTWLCSIAYHRCLDELRRGRRANTVDDFDVVEHLLMQPDPLMHPDRVEQRRALEHCLAKLKPRPRSQVIMRCYLGLSFVEIAEVVGEPAGTVQVRVSRALPRLQRCLRGEGVER